MKIDNKEYVGKKIWILEKSIVPMSKDESDKDKYVFMGPCASFDEKNDNDRLYESSDYLAKLEILQPYIKENSLLGELDHNSDYDVSMRGVSHIIKAVWYDEEKDECYIKIELVPTRWGQDVMAMVDKDVPIHISSRASGYIDDDGKVTLDEIYTYDIVYRPGFKKAKLDRLYEHKGLKSNVTIMEMKENHNNLKINNKSNQIINNNKNMDDSKEIKGYISKITEMFESLKNTVSQIQRQMNSTIKKGTNPRIVHEQKGMRDLNYKLKRTLSYIEEMKNVVNNNTTNDRKIIRHSNSITSTVNRLIECLSDTNNMVNNLMDKVDKLWGHQNMTAKFVNEMKSKQEKIWDHQNLAVKFINEMKSRQERMSDHQNLTAKFVNRMKTNEEKLWGHQNLTAKFVNEMKSKQETLWDHQNLTAKFVNEMAGKVHDVPSLGKHNIVKRVDKIINEAKRKRVAESQKAVESRYPFISKAHPATKGKFLMLNEDKKKNVALQVKKGKSIYAAMSSVAIPKNDVNEMYNFMSGENIKLYESLNEVNQMKVLNLFRLRNIRSKPEAELFFETLDLSKDFIKNKGNHRLIYEGNVTLGYADNDINKKLGI